jgi:hypothetical protein
LNTIDDTIIAPTIQNLQINANALNSSKTVRLSEAYHRYVERKLAVYEQSGVVLNVVFCVVVAINTTCGYGYRHIKYY